MRSSPITAYVTVYGNMEEVRQSEGRLITQSGILTLQNDCLTYTPKKNTPDGPKQAWRCAPGKQPTKIDVGQLNNLKREFGEHLLLPATKDHEGQLKQFFEVLQSFPPDIEGNILNVLRSPNTEFRLTQLETTVKDLLPAATDERPARSSFRWLSESDLVTKVLASALAVLIVLGAFQFTEIKDSAVGLFDDLMSSDEAPVEEEEIVEESAQQSQQAESSYEQIKLNLRTALVDTSVRFTIKDSLTLNHFNDWFAAPADDEDTQAYAMGLIELALAANDPGFDLAQHEDESRIETALIAAKGDNGSYPQFEENEADRLLALAFCQVDPSSTDDDDGRASPRPVFQTPSGTEIRFGTADDCTAISENYQEEAARQLEGLIEWLQSEESAAEESSPGEASSEDLQP